MATYHVTIFGKNYDAIADLIRKYEIDVFGPTLHQLADKSYRVDAYMKGKQIPKLKAKGYLIERHEDMSKRLKARLADVGKGNRYKQPKPS